MARLPASRGEVAEWLKAADCKSARASVRWFESSPLHHLNQRSFLPSRCAMRSLSAAENDFRQARAISDGFRGDRVLAARLNLSDVYRPAA